MAASRVRSVADLCVQSLTGRGPWCGTVRGTPGSVPIGDLGLVYLVALAVDRPETRRGADRAIDVDHVAAGPADQMVMIVADAIFEARR